MSDWDAERYHRLSNPQLGWGRRVLERLAPEPNERILDLGCGTGRLTAELSTVIRDGLLVAADRSETMLREASARDFAPLRPHPIHPARPSSRIQFVRADGLHLPFVDAFDAVLSTATFHWILDHDLLFASVYRALVPGGRLVAQCGGAGNLARLLNRSDRLKSRKPFAKYFDGWTDPWNFADITSTIGRLDRAGFTAIDVSLESAPTTLGDRDTFKDFLSTVCVREHVAKLPPKLRPDFLEALVEPFDNDTPPYTLDYWRLNIQARKPAGAERAA
jgi:trans-aconitate 2-methyltransferase